MTRSPEAARRLRPGGVGRGLALHDNVAPSGGDMPDYVDIVKARDLPGLRLVLTAGVPGPWGESAKAIFQVKGVAYTPVAQEGGGENAELQAWTGRANAPIAIYQDEPPRDGWADILALAERIAPEPSLVPEDPADRVRMLGLCHEICGPAGFGWQRRLMLLAPMLGSEVELPAAVRAVPERLGSRYGFTPAQAAAAPARTAQILTLLSDQLSAQRAAGSRYLVGPSLTAVDLYWAAFCAMVEPLSEADCPMPEGLRRGYRLDEPEVRKAADPALLEHRDFVYAEHLSLPLDF